MTPLLLLFLVVVVLGAAISAVRRARAGHRLVKTHHRALDTLGQITTSRVDANGPVVASDEERTHVRVVGDQPLSRPTTPRVPRQVRAGRRPTKARWLTTPPAERAMPGGYPAGATGPTTSDTEAAPDLEVARSEVGSGDGAPPRAVALSETDAGLAAARPRTTPRAVVRPGTEPATAAEPDAPEASGGRGGHEAQVGREQRQRPEGDGPERERPEAGRRRPAAAELTAPTVRASLPDRPASQGRGEPAPQARAGKPLAASPGQEPVTVSVPQVHGRSGNEALGRAPQPPADRPHPPRDSRQAPRVEQPATGDWVADTLGWTDDGIDDWWPAPHEPPGPSTDTETDRRVEGAAGTGHGPGGATGEPLLDDVYLDASYDPDDEGWIGTDTDRAPSGDRRTRRQAAQRRTRRRLAMAGSGALVVVIVVAAVLVLHHAGGGSPAPRATPRVRTIRHRPRSSTSSSTSTSTTTAAPANLVSSSPGDDVYQLQSTSATIVLATSSTERCWVLARQGGQTGPVTFESTLQYGQTQSFSGPYWFQLGAAASVTVTVNGTALNPPANGNGVLVLQFNAPS